jgi:hypothetical protein
MNNPRSGSQPRNTPVKDEAPFLATLLVVDAATRQVSDAHPLTVAEADDFASEVRLHFIERNYELRRTFHGRSPFRSDLVVGQHLLLDDRHRLRGRWRPSAEAKRQVDRRAGSPHLAERPRNCGGSETCSRLRLGVGPDGSSRP